MPKWADEVGVDPQQVAQADEQVVDQGDAGDEGEEHGADVQRQLHAVAGAGGRRLDDVGGVLLHLQVDRALGHGRAGLGEEDLGDDQATAGAAMTLAASSCTAKRSWASASGIFCTSARAWPSIWI